MVKFKLNAQNFELPLQINKPEYYEMLIVLGG